MNGAFLMGYLYCILLYAKTNFRTFGLGVAN